MFVVRSVSSGINHYFKTYSSYTPGPIDSKLGKKHKLLKSFRWKIQNGAMAAILKIYFRFFSWTKNPIDL